MKKKTMRTDSGKNIRKGIWWTLSLLSALVCIPFNAGHIMTAAIFFVMGCLEDEE